MVYLKAMFPSPPACVFFRRHVYHRHNVPHLHHRESDGENKVSSWLSTLKRHYDAIRNVHMKEFCSKMKKWLIQARLCSSCVLYNRGYLKGQLVCGLSCVTFGDVGSCDGGDVDWGFLRHQQMVPLVVDLEKKITTLATPCHFKKCILAILSRVRHVGRA